MHDSLIAYFNNHLPNPLTEDDKAVIRQTFIHKRLRRRQFLLEEGEVCKYVGFVVRGALKQYTVDDAGKENVLGLFIENWWAGDRESFSNDTPSPYFIEAVEDTDMLVTPKDVAMKVLTKQTFMNDLMRILTERQALQLLKRVHATKTYTAELRLADLEKNYPEFLQRFPQHIIASYLGMTKETLSRIRGNASRP